MQLKDEDIKHIREAFDSMCSKVDLLSLINYSKKILFGKNSIDIEMKQFNYHLSNKNSNRYTLFTIAKKNGGKRNIHAPNKGLKTIQYCLNLVLQTVFQPHKATFGFVPGKAIDDNAALHIGSHYVYNIDLKDFFPSITQARVYTCLKNPPFNLKNEKEKLKIANYIASLSCTAMEVERNKDGIYEKTVNNVLPQGAPTSPVITNVVCQRLDFLLSAVAKRFGLKYSRYADDITFSSQHSVYKKDSEFHKELSRIIKEERFEIKESKTRLQKQAYRQEVTGLVVNEKVNVQKRYIQQVRKWLYLWKKYGYDHASVIFLTEYLKDKAHVTKGNKNMIHVIDGKLSYLKMIKGDDDTVYKKLKKLYDKCSMDFYKNQSAAKPVVNESNLDLILEVLVNKGLETAMNMFK